MFNNSGNFKEDNSGFSTYDRKREFYEGEDPKIISRNQNLDGWNKMSRYVHSNSRWEKLRK
jgi:hypothetical protein